VPNSTLLLSTVLHGIGLLSLLLDLPILGLLILGLLVLGLPILDILRLWSLFLENLHLWSLLLGNLLLGMSFEASVQRNLASRLVIGLGDGSPVLHVRFLHTTQVTKCQGARRCGPKSPRDTKLADASGSL
jgi:hypothetical protein